MSPEPHHQLEPLARSIHVNPDTLRAAIRARLLEAVNIGTTTRPRWRISDSAWRAYLAARSSRTTSSAPTAVAARRPAARALKSYV